MLFMEIISNFVPETSKGIPRISSLFFKNIIFLLFIFFIFVDLYFASVMVICSLSLIANVYVLIFHHRPVKMNKMSPWVK